MCVHGGDHVILTGLAADTRVIAINEHGEPIIVEEIRGNHRF